MPKIQKIRRVLESARDVDSLVSVLCDLSKKALSQEDVDGLRSLLLNPAESVRVRSIVVILAVVIGRGVTEPVLIECLRADDSELPIAATFGLMLADGLSLGTADEIQSFWKAVLAEERLGFIVQSFPDRRSAHGSGISEGQFSAAADLWLRLQKGAENDRVREAFIEYLLHGRNRQAKANIVDLCGSSYEFLTACASLIYSGERDPVLTSLIIQKIGASRLPERNAFLRFVIDSDATPLAKSNAIVMAAGAFKEDTACSQFISTLARTLSSSEGMLLATACESLATMDSKESVRTLGQFAENCDDVKAATAIRSLAVFSFGSPTLADRAGFLLRAIETRPPSLVVEACSCLEEILNRAAESDRGALLPIVERAVLFLETRSHALQCSTHGSDVRRWIERLRKYMNR